MIQMMKSGKLVPGLFFRCRFCLNSADSDWLAIFKCANNIRCGPRGPSNWLMWLSKNERTNCIVKPKSKINLNNNLACFSLFLFLFFLGHTQISINCVHIEFDCFTLCQHDNSDVNMCMRRTWNGLCTQSNRTSAEWTFTQRRRWKKKSTDFIMFYYYYFFRKKKIHTE